MNISRSEMGAGPTEADWRELDTTPEFREFVGKKLDQLVSGMIKEKDRCKHLRSAPLEEGGVQLFAGAPPLEVNEGTPEEPPPPAKRPKLFGVDLQRYQLKKKSRRERDGTGAERDKQSKEKTDTSPAADRSAGDAKTAAPAGNGTTKDGKEGSDASSDSDSDDDDLARFAEAAVPADFMKSLAKSKTVKLDAA